MHEGTRVIRPIVSLMEDAWRDQAYLACLNTLRPRQIGRHFPDDIFKCIFVSENVWISLKISLSFVPNGPIKNIPALVQIMAWRRPGYKPLSELMMFSLPTHIWVTRPQWVNECSINEYHHTLIFLKMKCKIQHCKMWHELYVSEM